MEVKRPPAPIDRRTILKASLLGGSAAVAGLLPTNSFAGTETIPHSAKSADAGSNRPLPETAREIARDFFDYELSEADARAIAPLAESTLGQWRSIATRSLTVIDPPFDYSMVCAKARRLLKE